MFEECFNAVSRVFQGGFKEVLEKFPGSFEEVSKNFHGSFKEVLKKFQGCSKVLFKGLLRTLEGYSYSSKTDGCFKENFRVFQWTFKEISRVF